MLTTVVSDIVHRETLSGVNTCFQVLIVIIHYDFFRDVPALRPLAKGYRQHNPFLGRAFHVDPVPVFLYRLAFLYLATMALDDATNAF